MRYSSSEKDEAVSNTGLNRIEVKHRPGLLSDNSPCYFSGELKIYLGKNGIAHTRRAPYHPMAQGKIERYH
jgi:putative transposase